MNTSSNKPTHLLGISEQKSTPSGFIDSSLQFPFLSTLPQAGFVFAFRFCECSGENSGAMG